MTPPVLTLKAEKENVIQSLRNNVSPRTEPEAIFSEHLRGKEKHFSETAPYGCYYDSWKSNSPVL